MISAIIGLPGSGKSTLLSYIGHRAINNKSVNFRGFDICTTTYTKVFTNFPAKGGYKLNFDKLGIANYNHALLLCDEIQLFAESRNFKTFSDDLKFWFSNHRKFHLDFVYCTQDFDHVDKRIRDLTDRIYVVDMMPFHIIRCRRVLTTLKLETLGQVYSFGGFLDTHFFFAPRLYKYNDTFALMIDKQFEPVELIPWDSSKPSEVGSQLTDKGDFISYKENGEIEIIDKKDC